MGEFGLPVKAGMLPSPLEQPAALFKSLYSASAETLHMDLAGQLKVIGFQVWPAGKFSQRRYDNGKLECSIKRHSGSRCQGKGGLE